MKRFSVFALLFLGFAFSGIAQVSKVSGTVKASGNGAPLSGAHVGLSVLTTAGEELERKTITSAEGSFRFEDVPFGDAQIQISYVGYTPLVQDLRLDNPDISLFLELIPSELSLSEVSVSSLRKEKPLREAAMPFAVIRSDEMEGLLRPTLADMVSDQPGLNLVRDGIWGTSLNIRGLSENRIITMVDGNRLETATDLAAALSLIDPSDIERIEVIKGAASSLYGSGSLGGVVNIITQKAGYADDFYLNTQLWGGYQTVNELKTTRLALKAGNEKWHASLSGNLRMAENTQTPMGELENSQFNDRSLVSNVAYKLGDAYEIEAGYQHMYAWDVGIPGGQAFPTAAEATYRRATRDLFYLKLTGAAGKVLDRWSLNYFYQDILRDVIVYPNTSTTTTTQITTPLYFTPLGIHRTQGVSFQTEFSPGEKHSVVAGADLWSRHLFTSRTKYIQVEVLDSEGNVTAINNLIRGETPIPEAWFTSAGLFLTDEISLGDRLSIQLGGRVDGIFVENEESRDPVYLIVNGTRSDSPSNQKITYEASSEQDLSWSLNAGMVLHTGSFSDLSFSLARAYRSASLEERFKYIDLGSKVRVGDPELKPETGWSADLGWRTWTSTLEIGLNAYLNRVDNLITEVSGEYIYDYYTGSDTWVTDTLPALVNTNIDKGLLTGFDFSWKLIPAYRFVAGGSAALTLGYDLEEEAPLSQIPPFSGQLFVGYTIGKLGTAKVQSVFAADQHRVAEGESSTPGYAIYHIYFQTFPVRIGSVKGQFYTGLENIFDREYRNHLASNRGTVDVEPGRNLFLKLCVSF